MNEVFSKVSNGILSSYYGIFEKKYVVGTITNIMLCGLEKHDLNLSKSKSGKGKYVNIFL